MKYYKSYILSIAISAMTLLAIPAVAASPATTALNGHQILERTTSKIGKARCITTSFSMTANGQTAKGTLKMSGDKFFLTLPNARIWYDGRTLWSLDSSTKEVNISEPMPEELAQVNPMIIISSYPATDERHSQGLFLTRHAQGITAPRVYKRHNRCGQKNVSPLAYSPDSRLRPDGHTKHQQRRPHHKPSGIDLCFQ